MIEYQKTIDCPHVHAIQPNTLDLGLFILFSKSTLLISIFFSMMSG